MFGTGQNCSFKRGVRLTRVFVRRGSTVLNFTHPIVGIHIRRTDKIGTEAGYHSIHEYMSHVDQWFQIYEKTHEIETRRVYIATDHPPILEEARKKYRKYTFINNLEASKSAHLDTRYSDASLLGIILDIHFLSQSDYLVCTFSSQVCRLAYEMMQTLHVDASQWFYSLDNIYYYGGGNPHRQVTTAEHRARNKEEISLRNGDDIEILGDNKDGYSIGKNIRTKQQGLYPAYKAEDQPTIVRFE